MNKNDKALIIVPTYNERENISDIIDRVLSLPGDLEILIVDDNSPDGTGEIVAARNGSDKRIHLIRRPGKLGLGTAYVTGFKYAIEHEFAYIFEMDADFSHDPNEIPNFLKVIEHADLVIGSRYVGGIRIMNWPLSRLALSYFASIYTRAITGIPLHDTTSGFKCFRREVLESINLDKVHSGGYAFQVEMNWLAWKHGFHLVEIPIVFTDRTVGSSKMSKKIIREAMLMVWRLWLTGFFFHPEKRSDGKRPV